MSTQLPDISSRIRIDTSGLDKALGRANSGLGSFRARATAAFAGFSVAAAVGKIASLGIAYQDSLNIFQSVSDANAAQMKQVGEAAKALGNDLSLPNTSAAGAATALTELAKAGLSVNDALAAGKGTLQLATAGALSEGEAATIAANALNTFGLKGTQASRVANVLANAANVSSGEVADFAQGLAQGGLVAKQAGLSIEETAGALALFANNGLKGSDAGTSLKTALLRLQAPTRDVQTLMGRLGVNVRDSQGAMLPLSSIAQVLKDRLGGLSDAQRAQAMSAIFGSDAIRAGTLLFDAGAAGVDKYTTAVSKAGGAADVAAARSKGLGGALAGLKSTLETLSIDVFEGVAPSVERAVRAVTTAIPKFVQAAQAVVAQAAPVLEGFFAPLGQAVQGAAAGIQAALSGGLDQVDFSALGGKLGTGLATALGAGAGAAAKITVALGGLLAKIDFVSLAVQLGKAAPAVVLGFAIGLVNFDFGAVIGMLKDHWFEALLGVITIAFAPARVIGKVGEILARIPFVGSLLKFFLDAMVRVSSALVGAVGRLLGALADGFMTGFRQVFPVVGSAFARQLSILPTRLGLIGLRVVEIAKALPGQIGSAILSGATKVGEAVGSLIAGMIRRFTGIGALFFGIAGNIIGGLVSGITNGAGRVIAAIRESITDHLPSFLKKAFGISSPSKVFARLGEQIPAGLAVGIRSGLGPVRSALGDMTDLAGMRFGGAGFVQQRVAQVNAAAGSTGLTINGGITINSGGVPAEESLTRSLRNMAWTMGI